MMFILPSLHEFGHPCNPDWATYLSWSENIQKNKSKNIHQLDVDKPTSAEYSSADLS
jgi:hypothetical protein